MVRLVKGAKWTYGWVVVGPNREIAMPPPACCEFRFRAGETAIFTPGSRTSAGFGVSTPALLAEAGRRTDPVRLRELGRCPFGIGPVSVPPQIPLEQGALLLTVRGSRRALAFVAQGPIYEEALRHPEPPVFYPRSGAADPDEKPGAT